MPVTIPCSTMAGVVRVWVPIENALGDSAPPQGIVSGLCPACCHATACHFVSLNILIFSDYLNAENIYTYVEIHVIMSI